MFYGYHASDLLAEMMQDMSKMARSLGYEMDNDDFDSFDITISPHLRVATMLLKEETLKTALGRKINRYATL